MQKKKHQRVDENMGLQGEHITKFLSSTLHKTSSTTDVNKKDGKKNGHAIFLK
jgi:hypothetical protein